MFHVKLSKSFKKGDYMLIFDLAIIIVLFTNLAFMVWGYKYLVTLFHMFEDTEENNDVNRNSH